MDAYDEMIASQLGDEPRSGLSAMNGGLAVTELMLPVIAAYTAAVEAKERKLIADWLYKVGSIDSEDVRLVTTEEYLK